MSDLARVQELRREIGRLLAGNPPQVQGAILADLLAMWLAGHQASKRDMLLEMHLETVRKLVPLNAKAIRGR